MSDAGGATRGHDTSIDGQCGRLEHFGCGPTPHVLRRLGLLALYVVTIAAVLATACGGGNDDEVEAQKRLLDQMLLQADEFVPGLVTVSSSYSTNEDIADAKADPEKEMERLKQFGRQLGHEVTYQPGPDAPTDITIRAVNATASLYREPQGAHESFADGVETARTTDWQATHSDVDDVQVREIDLSGAADEAFWIRISGRQGQDMLVDDFILLRVERVRGFLRIVHSEQATAGEDAAVAQVKGWAVRQAKLIGAAIDGAE